jgi:glycosyltransferase involved in cell wall biosynthesis
LPSSEAIVHAQFARGGALALPIAMALDARLVVTLHGGDVSKQKNWMGTVLARRWAPLIRKTAKFVCVSAAVADIAALRGVPAEKLAVLPIGVEVPQEVPDRSAERREAHLFVGRFVEKKGINVLVNAMRRLRAEGDQTPLVCVGAGPLRPVLFALSREIPGVTLTGWLPPEAVRAQMAKAISVIVPSIVAGDGDSEGLPSVIPEAMMQGCAVIGSNQGGIAEVIRDGETGLLFAPNDPEALADAMGRITADTTIGLAGLAYARSELNAQVQSVKLEDLLLGG